MPHSTLPHDSAEAKEMYGLTESQSESLEALSSLRLKMGCPIPLPHDLRRYLQTLSASKLWMDFEWAKDQGNYGR